MKLINLFYEEIALKYNVSNDVVTDRESVFTSTF